MEVECGLEILGVEDDFLEDVADEIGFDYMSLLKGGAGMLQGAGGLLSGGQGGQSAATPTTSAAVEAQKLQAAKAAAESSARTWKIVGGITLGLLGLTGLGFLIRRTA